MLDSLIIHTGLISESQRVPLSDVMIVAAALQKQVVRDLGPIWNLRATVDPFERLEDMPVGYWPMVVKDDIDFPGAAGIHLDKDGQPFALISATDSMDQWSLTASHEVCEMLVDPFGNRLVAGDSPKLDQGRVMFLVEVCDPSEAADFAYSSNGVLVSDFYTPQYFDPLGSDGVRYSFTDAISEPRDVLEGGYLSWLDPETDEWWQETWFEGSQSQFRNLGKLTAMNGSFRARIDSISFEPTSKAIARGRPTAMAAGLPTKMAKSGRNARADLLHAQISAIVGEAQGGSRHGASAETRTDKGRDTHRRLASRRNQR
jgi:hypothetical protein